MFIRSPCMNNENKRKCMKMKVQSLETSLETREVYIYMQLKKIKLYYSTLYRNIARIPRFDNMFPPKGKCGVLFLDLLVLSCRSTKKNTFLGTCTVATQNIKLYSTLKKNIPWVPGLDNFVWPSFLGYSYSQWSGHQKNAFFFSFPIATQNI